MQLENIRSINKRANDEFGLTLTETSELALYDIRNSTGPETIFLCSDCYNLKYFNEVQKEIKYGEKKK